ncbi:hypothetical protein PHLGIDRAFT_374740 [Phlebiopsis gigantea 11061_1 CR5-6]|uniref:Uncharacterized protein n=1 Tax=Phlebiopsis gigantea (strain 11061_1 CR5-6) TaxID=745531 RepID=A0A0C3RYI1_PHLG1|nr:hypothetical protein PHLGIDRAFT_374740 [Phlebiopsis gigantea 11061_1 CR5-6]
MGQPWDIVNLDKKDLWPGRDPICNKLGEWFWSREVITLVDLLTERVEAQYRGWSAGNKKEDKATNLARSKSKLLKLPPELICAVFSKLQYIVDVINLCLTHDYLGEVGEPVLEVRIRQMAAFWAGDHIMCFGAYAADDDFPPQVMPYVLQALPPPAPEPVETGDTARPCIVENGEASEAANDEGPKLDDEHDDSSAEKEVHEGDIDGGTDGEHDDSDTSQEVHEGGSAKYTPPPTEFYHFCRQNYSRGFEYFDVDDTLIAAYGRIALTKSEKQRLDNLLWHGVRNLVKMPPYRSRVLCNITKGVYVRADAVDDLAIRVSKTVKLGPGLTITLGQAMLSMICWSSDYSCALRCDSERLARGPWTGDAFRVTTFDRWNPKEDTRAWRDASDEVVQWLEELWKTSVIGEGDV